MTKYRIIKNEYGRYQPQVEINYPHNLLRWTNIYSPCLTKWGAKRLIMRYHNLFIASQQKATEVVMEYELC